MKKYLLIKYFEIVRSAQSCSRSHIGVIATGICLGVLANLSIIFGLLLVTIISFFTNKLWKTSLLALLFIASFAYTSHFVNIRLEESSKIYDTQEIVLTAKETGVTRDFNQVVIASNNQTKSDVLTIVPKYPQINQGESFLVSTKLESFPDYYSQSYVSFLNSKNVFLYTEASSIQEIHEAPLFYSVLNNVRNSLQESILSSFNEPHASLLNGIVLGYDEDFTDEYKDQLQKTGTTHITAVSGFNFLILFTIVMKLSSRVRRPYLLIASIFIMLSYILIVGVANISALRAAIMIIAIIVAELLGKPRAGFETLLLTIALMLVYSPLLITNISFQLSFAATTGILIFSKRISIALPQFLGEFLRDITGVTLAAFIATSPIIAFSFGTQDFIAILANIVISEAIGIATILGITFLFFDKTLSFMAEFLAVITESILWSINELIFIMASTPSLQIQNPLLYLFFIFGIFIVLDFRYTKLQYE